MEYSEEIKKLERAICENSEIEISNVNYVVSAFFSESGSDSVYDQFLRLLIRQFAHSQ